MENRKRENESKKIIKNRSKYKNKQTNKWIKGIKKNNNRRGREREKKRKEKKMVDSKVQVIEKLTSANPLRTSEWMEK